MASPGGACSGSTQIQTSGSDSDPKHVMDPRKRKRMISNRESARRSRLRKQQHLDELMTQAGRLSEENSSILGRVDLTTQMYVRVEGENSVLRAQLAELTHRLDSLNMIIDCLSSNFNSNSEVRYEGMDHHRDVDMMMDGGDFLNPWNLMCLNQPVMY